MKLISVVGARPQFIKVAPILRAVTAYNTENRKGIEHILVHTGQHYDYEMSQAFFIDLDLPAPDYNLGAGSGSHGVQTGKMLEGIEEVLLNEKPDLVLVYGDTNSTLAAALAAVKLHIPMAHVEAGLRDNDKQIPEEVNRILTDHVSSLLCCPSVVATQNLQKEGVGRLAFDGHLMPLATAELLPFDLNHPLVLNTGDVMVDALMHNVQVAEGCSSILQNLGLFSGEGKAQEYLLATVHRAENTDDPNRLVDIFSALDRLAQKGHKVIIPLHPRTRKALAGVSGGDGLVCNLEVIDPVPYRDMLALESNAQVVLTDSGGIQKEAFLLRVPCITLRETTGWVETVEAGWNRLVGADRAAILKATQAFLVDGAPDTDATPYGDSHAAERIVRVLVRGED